MFRSMRRIAVLAALGFLLPGEGSPQSGDVPANEYGLRVRDDRGNRIPYTLEETETAGFSPIASARDAQDGSLMPFGVTAFWAYPGFGTGIGLSKIVLSNGEIIAGGSTNIFGPNSYFYILRPTGTSYEPVFASRRFLGLAALGAADVIGDSRTEIVVVQAGGIVYLFDQESRAELSEFGVGANDVTGMALHDLDGDGKAEILLTTEALGGSNKLIIRSGSGSTIWEKPGAGGRDVAVANMDGDPSLEIAVGAGAVIDWATRTVQWQRPQGFGGSLAVGDIDGDGMAELITVSLTDFLAAFDVDTQLRKWSITALSNPSVIWVGNVDADADLEMVVADAQCCQIHAFNTITLADEWTITAEWGGATSFAVGDVNGDGTTDLLWGAGAGSSGPDRLYVANLASRTIDWESFQLEGPFIAPQIGDVDGDGLPEIVTASHTSDVGNSGRIVVLDGETMRARAVSQGVVNNSSSEGIRDLKLRNVDGDPQLEIVVASDRGRKGVIEIYDFAPPDSFQLKWMNGDLPTNKPFSSVDVADVDADGALEVIGSAWDSGGSPATPGSVLYVYSYDTGREEWHSPVLSPPKVGLGLAVLTAGGGVADIVVAVGLQRLEIYSGTGQFQASIPSAARYLAPIDAVSQRSFVVGGETGDVRVYESQGAGYTEVWSRSLGTTRVDGVTFLDSGAMAVTSSGRLKFFPHRDDPPAWTSEDYGAVGATSVGLGAMRRPLVGGEYALLSLAPWRALLGVQPSSGPFPGGTSLSATGSAFAPGARMFVGNRETLATQMPDATHANGITPQLVPCSANDVCVVNPDMSFEARANAFTATCGACPLVPLTAPPGAVGSPYAQAFSQLGGSGSVTWSITGALPAGITFDSGLGSLAGTATESGLFPILVSATDATGCAGTRSYALAFNCQAIAVNPVSISQGTVGSPYSRAFTQTGGIGTVSFRLIGVLPTGLAFDTQTGVLAGTPTLAGQFPISVVATDSNGCTGIRPYLLVINCRLITVSPPSIPGGALGVPYSQTFGQTNGTGTVLWSTQGTLPAGISFSPGTATLAGTPTVPGNFVVTVFASDEAGCSGNRTYPLAIACQPMTVEPAGAIPVGIVNTPYSQPLSQTGGIGSTTWSISGTIPTGITVHATTGVLYGLPMQVGTFPITIRATDSNGCFGTRNYSLVVICQSNTVIPSTIPPATAGFMYSQAFSQTNGVAPITWSLTGALPAGMAFNASTRVLSGAPMQTGSFPFSISATDANGCVGTQAYTLVVNCPTVTLNPASIPSGTAGTPYSQLFTQTPGLGTIAWSVTGALPAGLALNPATGALSGIPTQTGSFPITVRATLTNGCSGSRAYTLVINCQNITVSPASLPAGTVGASYSQTLSHTSGIGAITWSVIGTLPTGLTLDASTGTLSGTPTEVGSFPITVRATDANGCTGSRAYTLVVACQTITIAPPAIPAAVAGAPYAQAFTQTSGIGAIAWSLTGTLPTGVTFVAATAELTGTPTQTGTFPITLNATDSNACGGTRAYAFLVNRAGPFVGLALAADTNGNRVFDPGESAAIAPTWRNDTGATEAVTGAATTFIGPGSATTYSILDGAAGYGALAAGASGSCLATSDCYVLRVSVPNPRPLLHWDASFVETLSNGDAKTWTVHVGQSFNDVSVANPFYRFVETVLHHGVTGGCSATTYCPSTSTTRGQMAVFVLVSKEGPGFAPPACGVPMFADVPASSPYCRWVEELARRGIVGGCGGGNYCPSAVATREAMAVFVLRALDPSLTPAACSTPMFADVPASSPFCRWIEELARRGVVSGCGGSNYCPAAAVSREQMAVFLSATFGLTLYGS
jgi:hypothetical protein